MCVYYITYAYSEISVISQRDICKHCVLYSLYSNECSALTATTLHNTIQLPVNRENSTAITLQRNYTLGISVCVISLIKYIIVLFDHSVLLAFRHQYNLCPYIQFNTVEYLFFYFSDLCTMV